ncbi:glycoprotein-N-acetylgalactosamine 3-beta-galactosyltransferase 1-A-like [Haliotis rubra]|uniref:glycoprotein-N-acetylgalactosamine 3-beta-galactosyltransferase 1-A-like n=1 Tax=Haliotis rubra TaxID=36100 RepID=UPI001EE5B8C2|nr:glycoprotein-N-acetylgalactosamine 3-beta-galactosyltransferase 1-A-like [Haliotis rubra]
MTASVRGAALGLTVVLLTYNLKLHWRNNEEGRPNKHSVVYRHDADHTQHRRRSPRILCWVLTQPKNLKNRTTAVKETWASECDTTLFFSSLTDSTFPTIGLGFEEKRRNLIKKTMGALRYIFKHYIHKADWFLKADDDTYVVVDNVRHFLKEKNPDEPVYYGSKFRLEDFTYHSGGAGYVMSRELLKNIVLHSNQTQECEEKGAEDRRIGMCVKALGGVTGNSTDHNNQEVFHWSSAEYFMTGQTDTTPSWVRMRQTFWKQEQTEAVILCGDVCVSVISTALNRNKNRQRQ